VGHSGGSRWESQPSPHCRRTFGADRAPSPAAQEGAEPTATAAEEVAEGAVATEALEEAPAEAVAVEAQEEALAEAGLVDIASILGAPTVTVVRSSL
jgi:hypothetical protein